MLAKGTFHLWNRPLAAFGGALHYPTLEDMPSKMALLATSIENFFNELFVKMTQQQLLNLNMMNMTLLYACHI